MEACRDNYLAGGVIGVLSNHKVAISGGSIQAPAHHEPAISIQWSLPSHEAAIEAVFGKACSTLQALPSIGVKCWDILFTERLHNVSLILIHFVHIWLRTSEAPAPVFQKSIEIKKRRVSKQNH